MRHELRVDFEKLGWSTWIISPKWYDAYFCAGACAFPLGQNQRPTNHATVQSIVHELSLTAGVGAPCCVPTELHSISLLYFDEHMNVVLKQYDDMVAAGCGCQ
ncbi:UNVERIFIED_CONTAM: Bone morphogenetic protein 3 [Trichonephila clavipes]